MNLFCLFLLAAFARGEDAPDYRTRPELPTRQTRCNTDLMVSYGLTGIHNSIRNPNPHCPMLVESCCSQSDETATVTLWKTHYAPRVQKYYELFLYSVRFLLGYSNEGSKLARDYLLSEDARCKRVAEDFIATNMNQDVNDKIYQVFLASLERVADLRRGFFCILCDARFHRDVTESWDKGDPYHVSRIFLSKEFCKRLVSHTVRAAYYSIFYLNSYVENLSSLINCRTKSSNALLYDVDYWTKQHVKNCYYFRHKYFFFFCERYCEHFALTRASPLFDGELSRLRKFVEQIVAHRDEAFYMPRVNLLVDSYAFDRQFSKNYFEEVLGDSVIFPPTYAKVRLELIKTDVQFEGGSNLWDLVEGNDYEIVLSSAAVAGLFALTSFVFALF